MKAVCTNDANHKEFVTSVAVSQEWKVDENGELIMVENSCAGVIKEPSAENIWHCAICGAKAIVN